MYGWLCDFYSVRPKPPERICFEKKYFSRIKRAPRRHDGAGARKKFVGSQDSRYLGFASWQEHGRTLKLMATYCGREGGLRLDPVHPVSSKILYLKEGVETAESWTIEAGP